MKVPAGGYPPPPSRESRPGYKPRPGGYQGNSGAPRNGGYQGNKPGGAPRTSGPGQYNSRPPYGKPAPKQEELDPTTTKPVNVKKNPNNKKKKPAYDRFSQFDNKESKVRIDQKTRTQMKKEPRNERQKE